MDIQTDKKERFLKSKWALPAGRVLAHYTLAIACLLVPEVGENRYLIAGLLMFVIAPIGGLLTYLRGSNYSFRDHLFDIVTVVVVAHFAPSIWHALLVIGLCVALTTIFSVRVNRTIHTLNFIVLVFGMTSAALLHNIDGWHLPIIALCCTIPANLFYARIQFDSNERLRRKVKAQEDLRLLAGGVAHDFNNILTGVIGYSEIALTQLTPGHPAHQTIQEAIASASRAELVSQQLLAFSGKSAVSHIEIDLAKEIPELSALLTPAMLKDVQLSLELSGEPLLVQFDRAQLQQVLFNIILNAVEATRPTGKVTVSAKKQGNTVSVKVIDTGIGIYAAEIDRVFDPFYTSKPKGHGLGLAAVQRIILAHKGEIRIKSEPGVGTEMLVLLPSCDVEDA